MSKVRPFWDLERHIGSVSRNDRGEEIRIRRVSKDDRDYIDVRTFYPGRDGNMRPARGIVLPIDTASDVADLIHQAVASGDEAS